MVTFHLSMALVMFSIKSIRASAVDLLFLNRYWELLKRLYLLYPQTKVGDILDSGPSRRRRRRNFLVDAITQKQINIFFSNLVHMLRVPKGRSLF